MYRAVRTLYDKDKQKLGELSGDIITCIGSMESSFFKLTVGALFYFIIEKRRLYFVEVRDKSEVFVWELTSITDKRIVFKAEECKNA